jgi:hypothetical protein
MALPLSGQLSASAIRSEFGESGQWSISNYKVGGGQVANHQANESIPSTNSNIRFSNFYGAEDKFTAILTTGEGSGGAEGLRGFGDPGGFGSITRNRIGKSKSTTTQVTLTGFYQSTIEVKGVFTYTIYFSVAGNNFSEWFSSIALDNEAIPYASLTGEYSSEGDFTLWSVIIGSDAWPSVGSTNTVTVTLV